VSRVTTHVLDNASGRPARGVPVSLYRISAAGDHGPPGLAAQVGSAITDGDGRAGPFSGDDLPAGTYRLVFDTATYFAGTGQRSFYPEVCVSFLAESADGHYHVPLLLSPFAYTTYRGS
jgi:5-hydroxyisourate hydrolase